MNIFLQPLTVILAGTLSLFPTSMFLLLIFYLGFSNSVVPITGVVAIIGIFLGLFFYIKPLTSKHKNV